MVTFRQNVQQVANSRTELVPILGQFLQSR